MGVGIVTDSACCLPSELAEGRGIKVVPMGLALGGRPVAECSITCEELLSRIGEGASTAAPAPAALVDAISAADTGDGVLVLTVSRRMSSTFQVAGLAARMAGSPVAVVDTGTAAVAEGLVALAAADHAASGHTLPEVEAHAREVGRRVRLVATVPSLDHLSRSGRVPQAAEWARRWLDLRPLFEFRQGYVRPLRPALGADSALERMVRRWEVATAAGTTSHAAVVHALAEGDAVRLESSIRRRGGSDVFVGSFGPAMVVHTGPGLIGMAWWRSPADGPRRPANVGHFAPTIRVPHG